jgi:hypothetical protein
MVFKKTKNELGRRFLSEILVLMVAYKYRYDIIPISSQHNVDYPS